MPVNWLADLDQHIHSWGLDACLCSCGEHETVRRTAEEDEDFIEYELALATILGNAYRKKLKEAELLLAQLTDDEETQTEDNLITVLNDANLILSKTYDEAVEEDVSYELLLAALAGGALVLSGSQRVLTESNSFDDVVAGIVRSVGYYTNNHFNMNVIPAIIQTARHAMERQNPMEPFTFTAIREQIETRFKSVPYWRVVANAAASRGYHYGLLKAGSLSGYTGYRFKAVLDGKTSSTCRALNGKTFWLADGLQLVERIALADAKEVKDLAPWRTAEQLEGKSADELIQLGAILPPLHGNCRSTIVLV